MGQTGVGQGAATLTSWNALIPSGDATTTQSLIFLTPHSLTSPTADESTAPQLQARGPVSPGRLERGGLPPTGLAGGKA